MSRQNNLDNSDQRPYSNRGRAGYRNRDPRNNNNSGGHAHNNRGNRNQDNRNQDNNQAANVSQRSRSPRSDHRSRSVNSDSSRNNNHRDQGGYPQLEDFRRGNHTSSSNYRNRGNQGRRGGPTQSPSPTHNNQDIDPHNLPGPSPVDLITAVTFKIQGDPEHLWDKKTKHFTNLSHINTTDAVLNPDQHVAGRFALIANRNQSAVREYKRPPQVADPLSSSIAGKHLLRAALHPDLIVGPNGLVPVPDQELWNTPVPCEPREQLPLTERLKNRLLKELDFHTNDVKPATKAQFRGYLISTDKPTMIQWRGDALNSLSQCGTQNVPMFRLNPLLPFRNSPSYTHDYLKFIYEKDQLKPIAHKQFSDSALTGMPEQQQVNMTSIGIHKRRASIAAFAEQYKPPQLAITDNIALNDTISQLKSCPVGGTPKLIMNGAIRGVAVLKHILDDLFENLGRLGLLNEAEPPGSSISGPNEATMYAEIRKMFEATTQLSADYMGQTVQIGAFTPVRVPQSDRILFVQLEQQKMTLDTERKFYALQVTQTEQDAAVMDAFVADDYIYQQRHQLASLLLWADLVNTDGTRKYPRMYYYIANDFGMYNKLGSDATLTLTFLVYFDKIDSLRNNAATRAEFLPQFQKVPTFPGPMWADYNVTDRAYDYQVGQNIIGFHSVAHLFDDNNDGKLLFRAVCNFSLLECTARAGPMLQLAYLRSVRIYDQLRLYQNDDEREHFLTSVILAATDETEDNDNKISLAAILNRRLAVHGGPKRDKVLVIETLTDEELTPTSQEQPPPPPGPSLVHDEDNEEPVVDEVFMSRVLSDPLIDTSEPVTTAVQDVKLPLLRQRLKRVRPLEATSLQAKAWMLFSREWEYNERSLNELIDFVCVMLGIGHALNHQVVGKFLVAHGNDQKLFHYVSTGAPVKIGYLHYGRRLRGSGDAPSRIINWAENQLCCANTDDRSKAMTLEELSSHLVKSICLNTQNTEKKHDPEPQSIAGMYIALAFPGIPQQLRLWAAVTYTSVMMAAMIVANDTNDEKPLPSPIDHRAAILTIHQSTLTSHNNKLETFGATYLDIDTPEAHLMAMRLPKFSPLVPGLVSTDNKSGETLLQGVVGALCLLPHFMINLHMMHKNAQFYSLMIHDINQIRTKVLAQQAINAAGGESIYGYDQHTQLALAIGDLHNHLRVAGTVAGYNILFQTALYAHKRWNTTPAISHTIRGVLDGTIQWTKPNPYGLQQVPNSTIVARPQLPQLEHADPVVEGSMKQWNKQNGALVSWQNLIPVATRQLVDKVILLIYQPAMCSVISLAWLCAHTNAQDHNIQAGISSITNAINGFAAQGHFQHTNFVDGQRRGINNKRTILIANNQLMRAPRGQHLVWTGHRLIRQLAITCPNIHYLALIMPTSSIEFVAASWIAQYSHILQQATMSTELCNSIANNSALAISFAGYKLGSPSVWPDMALFEGCLEVVMFMRRDGLTRQAHVKRICQKKMAGDPNPNDGGDDDPHPPGDPDDDEMAPDKSDSIDSQNNDIHMSHSDSPGPPPSTSTNQQTSGTPANHKSQHDVAVHGTIGLSHNNTTVSGGLTVHDNVIQDHTAPGATDTDKAAIDAPVNEPHAVVAELEHALDHEHIGSTSCSPLHDHDLEDPQYPPTSEKMDVSALEKPYDEEAFTPSSSLDDHDADQLVIDAAPSPDKTTTTPPQLVPMTKTKNKRHKPKTTSAPSRHSPRRANKSK